MVAVPTAATAVMAADIPPQVLGAVAGIPRQVLAAEVVDHRTVAEVGHRTVAVALRRTAAVAADTADNRPTRMGL